MNVLIFFVALFAFFFWLMKPASDKYAAGELGSEERYSYEASVNRVARAAAGF